MKCRCGGRARRICDIVTSYQDINNIPEITETELYQCYDCHKVFTYQQGLIN